MTNQKLESEEQPEEGMTCSGHKKDLFGQTDMKLAAEAIGDLHYPTLHELVGRLATKLYTDSVSDRIRGREKLGYALFDASEHLKEAAERIGDAVKISKPFMKASKEPAGEKMFTLKQALDIWEAAGEYEYREHFGSVPNKQPDKRKYFKDKFNIEL